MGLGGARWVKNFSVGICDGAASTAHSSLQFVTTQFRLKLEMTFILGVLSKLSLLIIINLVAVINSS